VVVNEATGLVYARNGSVSSTKVYDGTSLAQVGTIGMAIRDTDGVNNRLYFSDGTVLRQLDGTTLLQTGFLNGEGNGAVIVDDVHNWLFTAAAGSDTVKIFDGATMTLLDSIALGAGQQVQQLATGGDGYVYALTCTAGCASTSMAAIEVVSSVPEPATAVILAFGLAGFGAGRRRRR
jgi:DNA-binding beta-propeller fold protein YncE